jgi:ketosteroid isomerase-like protein
MSTPNTVDLQLLLDKQALFELVCRYSRSVDRADPELFLTCYHPDAYDDHGQFKGNPKDFLAHLQRGTMIPANGPVQHSISNAVFDVRGDVAFGECYFQTRSIGKDGVAVASWGRYVDRFERRNGEWKIARRECILEYARPGFSTADFVQTRRDREDPSYRR